MSQFKSGLKIKINDGKEFLPDVLKLSGNGLTLDQATGEVHLDFNNLPITVQDAVKVPYSSRSVEVPNNLQVYDAASADGYLVLRLNGRLVYRHVDDDLSTWNTVTYNGANIGHTYRIMYSGNGWFGLIGSGHSPYIFNPSTGIIIRLDVQNSNNNINNICIVTSDGESFPYVTFLSINNNLNRVQLSSAIYDTYNNAADALVVPFVSSPGLPSTSFSYYDTDTYMINDQVMMIASLDSGSNDIARVLKVGHDTLDLSYITIDKTLPIFSNIPNKALIIDNEETVIVYNNSASLRETVDSVTINVADNSYEASTWSTPAKPLNGGIVYSSLYVDTSSQSLREVVLSHIEPGLFTDDLYNELKNPTVTVDIPDASASVKGLVKIGDNINVDNSGEISVPTFDRQTNILTGSLGYYGAGAVLMLENDIALISHDTDLHVVNLITKEVIRSVGTGYTAKIITRVRYTGDSTKVCVLIGDDQHQNVKYCSDLLDSSSIFASAPSPMSGQLDNILSAVYDSSVNSFKYMYYPRYGNVKRYQDGYEWGSYGTVALSGATYPKKPANLASFLNGATYYLIVYNHNTGMLSYSSSASNTSLVKSVTLNAAVGLQVYDYTNFDYVDYGVDNNEIFNLKLRDRSTGEYVTFSTPVGQLTTLESVVLSESRRSVTITDDKYSGLMLSSDGSIDRSNIYEQYAYEGILTNSIYSTLTKKASATDWGLLKLDPDTHSNLTITSEGLKLSQTIDFDPLNGTSGLMSLDVYNSLKAGSSSASASYTSITLESVYKIPTTPNLVPYGVDKSGFAVPVTASYKEKYSVLGITGPNNSPRVTDIYQSLTDDIYFSQYLIPLTQPLSIINDSEVFGYSTLAEVGLLPTTQLTDIRNNVSQYSTVVIGVGSNIDIIRETSPLIDIGVNTIVGEEGLFINHNLPTAGTIVSIAKISESGKISKAILSEYQHTVTTGDGDVVTIYYPTQVDTVDPTIVTVVKVFNPDFGATTHLINHTNNKDLAAQQPIPNVELITSGVLKLSSSDVNNVRAIIPNLLVGDILYVDTNSYGLTNVPGEISQPVGTFLGNSILVNIQRGIATPVGDEPIKPAIGNSGNTYIPDGIVFDAPIDNGEGSEGGGEY